MPVVRRFLIALVALATAGCPDSTSGSKAGPPATCTKRGEQCKLADGVLGVCNDVACPAGKDPPCLGCVSQH
ncbi:MAG: hypothetical protein HS104_18880 [Polyangiaceae bacterium]|nr:hypothetical protein [Polyangiaceae bacterium]MCE7890565.1 hypothetical protein [Sorangiineae bacterium PRO1]MCL4752860.1 hypothetical protein [Myxococcales bacterium]